MERSEALIIYSIGDISCFFSGDDSDRRLVFPDILFGMEDHVVP